jgi:hypothetical protein
MVIKFINIIKLNQEITSIVPPPYFFRTQNVAFRKQLFISFSISSDKTEEGRLKFSNHKDLKHQEKHICGKRSSKKYSIISEQRCILKTSWPTLEKEAVTYSEMLAANYQKTVTFIISSMKTANQKHVD